VEYRRIEGTDLEVSAVSLGCWTLGGLQYNEGRMIGWRPVEEAEAVRAVHLALDAGVNHFDNADAYGHGRAEQALARALEGVSREAIVASKVGFFRGTAEHPYHPFHIRRQCEQSLVNLRRECLDIYYLHNTHFGEDDRYLDGAVETLRRLRDEGKIRVIGLSSHSAEDFVKYVPLVEPQVLQGRASMMDRRLIDPDSPACRLMEERSLRLVCFSPLEQGVLLDKYSAKDPPKFPDGDVRQGKERFGAEGLAALEPALARLGERFGTSTRQRAAAALSFLLAHERVLCAIPGFRNPEQVECNLSCGGKAMSAEDAALVREVFPR
jgi:aryl-alcohol dehydrogenase-like predicted oxidoreductase